MSVGVRRLGSSRLEIATLVEPTESGWVALPGPLGEEAAQVVAQQLFHPLEVEALPARPLSSVEVMRVPDLWSQTLSRMPSLLQLITFPVLGLRPPLSGGLVVEVALPLGLDSTAILQRAMEQLGFPIVLQPVSFTSRQGGLTPPSPITGRTNVGTWLERLGVNQAFPGGFPRLGTRVHTPRGAGTVFSVRTKDRTVLVHLDHGETVRFAVDTVSLLRE